MSSVRLRPSGRYQARVTVHGRTYSKTFTTHADASKWARQAQVDAERGLIEPPRPTLTLHGLIDRYMREVLPRRRSIAQALFLLKAWQRRPIAGMKAWEVQPRDVAMARDARLQEVSSGAVRRELDELSCVFTWATRDLQMCDSNPVKAIRKPAHGRARDRRISPEELERVKAAAVKSPDLVTIITLAVETAMRRSEILGLRWANVDTKRRVAHLPLTKNGMARDVPLSPAAVALLDGLPRRLERGGKVFSKNATSLSSAFQRAVQRARAHYVKECQAQGKEPDEKFLVDIRLHDCRHEAASRLAERGFSLLDVAVLTGHKSMQTVKRYTHVRAEHIAARMAA